MVAAFLLAILGGAPVTGAPSQAPAAPAEIAVDPRVLERYVGRYQVAPIVFITVTREDAHLFVQFTDQGRFEVYPENDTTFFWKVVNARLTFQLDAAGKTTMAVLHQLGRDLRAPRLEGEPVMPREIALAAEVFDRYIGRYRLAPGVEMTISRDGRRMLAQLTGQSAVEIFATSERQFFAKVVDAQLTFEPGPAGQPAAVVLHQFGKDQRATRIE
jgi:hypothetical protein